MSVKMEGVAVLKRALFCFLGVRYEDCRGP